MNRVLVISPHPDDESIGCGGTLRRHVVQGDSVRVIFLSSGENGGHGRAKEETLKVREKESKQAAAILGIDQMEFWRQPDSAVRATKEMAGRLRKKIREWRPKMLYVPHDREMHQDHRAAARLVRRALCRKIPATPMPAVLQYEVWTPLQRMDEVVDITAYIETKMAAIRAHETQCSAMRFDDAILGLNRYRGEMFSWPEGDYAEIFARLRL